MSERVSRLEDLPDEELMLRYARDEEPCFEVLLHRYRRSLYSFLFRYLGRADRAEDVFQDVFYEVIRARKRYRPHHRFAAWLFQIARNRAVDRLRRNRLREMASLDDPLDTQIEGRENRVSMVSGVDPDPEEQAQAMQLGAALQEVLMGLPPEQREALWLKEKSGLTISEIARLTGVSENTVKSRLRYALEKIRVTMSQMGFSQ